MIIRKYQCELCLQPHVVLGKLIRTGPIGVKYNPHWRCKDHIPSNFLQWPATVQVTKMNKQNKNTNFNFLSSVDKTKVKLPSQQRPETYGQIHANTKNKRK